MNGTWGREVLPAELLLATALVRTWVRSYTALLHEEVRARRRGEIESDLWEHRAHAELNEVSPGVTAVELLIRFLLGIPDDVLWRFGAARAESRAARERHRAGGLDMSISARSKIASSAILGGVLWLLLVALGVLFVLTGTDPDETGWAKVFWGLAIVVTLVFIRSVRALLVLDHDRFGRIGLQLFIAGAAVTVAMPLLALFELWIGWVLPIGFLGVLVGWWTFALSNLRTRALPRWNWLPAVIGVIPLAGAAFLEVTDWSLAIGGAAFGVAWLLLAYSAASGEAVPRTAR